MRRADQNQRDHQRKAYRLHFPVELDAETVTSWLRSISGTLRSSKMRMAGVPTLAFEVWATSKGIEHRLKVPWTHADYVVAQLHALVPGIRVTDDDEFPRRLWTRAVEVGLSHSSRQLRIHDAAATSASLLASVQALEAGEAVLLQWVATPAVPTHPPIYKDARTDRISPQVLMKGTTANRDEVNDRRAKLEEPNVQAVLRVAAAAKTNERADHLIFRVRASLASVRSPSTKFTKRMVSAETLQKRIDHTSSSLIFPMQLAVSELCALLAWPIGSPHVSGLPAELARQLPAPDAVPRKGRVIGVSNFPGAERRVAVSYVDALKHVHVVGPTGVGKTALLANMLRQDIQNGYGVVLIESKGDLFHAALNYVPWERLNDVVVLDVNDTKNPIGFNVLQQGDPRVVVDEIIGLFEYLYRDSRSVWTREVLYHALQTLITDPKYTFVDLAPLLVPMTTDEVKWADDLVRSLKDRELKAFWQRFHNQPRTAQDRITQPVMDRVWQLNVLPEVRHIIGQSESGFDMADVIKNNKILLVNLSGLPRDTATLTGTLLMNSLWHAVKSNRGARPTFLFLDEFQDFMNLPIDPEDMLAKARGFGLGMTLAHQHLGQLPNEMRQAISANARTKVSFQTSNDDAKVLAREFGTAVTEHDFMHLGRYEVLARIATGDGVSAPLSLNTLPPAPGHNYRQELLSRSRTNHSKPVGRVQADIDKRRRPEQAPRTRRPSVGTDPTWG